MSKVRVPLIQDLGGYRYGTGQVQAPFYMQNLWVKKIGNEQYVTKRRGYSYYRSDASSKGYGIHYWNDVSSDTLVTVEDNGTTTATYYGTTTRTKIGDLTNRLSTSSYTQKVDFCETIDPYLIVHAHTFSATENLYYIDSSYTQTRLTNATNGYPSTDIVPGVVELDGYVFVMDIDGKIYNSNLSDITTWTSTDFIQASRRSDEGRYICKHNDNIVAVGSESIEFFYNAGNPNGSPLSPRSDVFYNIGVIDTDNIYGGTVSIDSNDSIIAFIGTERGTKLALGVYVVENFKIKNITVPPLLDYIDDSMAVQIQTTADNRTLIILNNANYNFVYDLSTQLWTKWTYKNDEHWQFSSIESIYALQFDNASVHYLTNFFADTDSTGETYFNIEINLQPWDGGTGANKFCRSTQLIGENPTNSATTVQLKWKDDARSEPYITARDIDLSNLWPLYRCGVFKTRQFNLSQTASQNDVMLKAIELDVVGVEGNRSE